MNYLITGGAGFIGSHLSNYLNSLNQNVLVVDCMSYASQPENLHPNIRVEEIDIASSKVPSIIQDFRPDIIMNLAAQSHVDRSINSPEEFISSNIFGVLNILEALRGSSIRFHQVSTDEVFGDLKQGDAPFTEEHPYKPSSVYSASKASADHLVNAYIRTHNINATITSCSNNYGKFQHEEKFIPSVIKSILDNKPVCVYGDGLNVRDWIHVMDHVEALHLVAENANSGEHYLVGGSNEKANIDVVKDIASVCSPNKKIDINYVDDRKGHDYRYAVNANKISRDLGWSPKRKWYKEIENTINWYKEKYNARYAATRS